MVDYNTPIELDSFKDVHPVEILQTGYKTLKTYVVEMTMPDVDFGVITDELDWRNEEHWSGVADDDTDLAEDVPLTQYIMRGLGGQVIKWLYDRAYSGDWVSIADSDTTKLLFPWYTIFRQALHRNEPLTYKDDGTTAATTLAEAIQGLDWNDEGVGAAARMQQWMYRFATFQGVRYSKIVPGLTDKLDAASETNRIRIEMILSALAAVELIYLFPMLAAQSERAMFALAAHHESDLNRKFPTPEALASTVDPIWLKWTEKLRFDVTDSNIADHIGQTGRWIQPYALQGASLDTAFKRARQNYRVPVFAVNFAKTFAGICKTEVNDVEEHIAMLYTFHPPDDAAYDAIAAAAWTHGKAEWILGLDLSLVLDWLITVEDIVEKACRTLVGERAHFSWSGAELTKIVDDMWVDFNFTRTISGYASPIIGRVVDRHLRFQDSAKVTGTPITGGQIVYNDDATVVDGTYMAATNYLDPEDLDGTTTFTAGLFTNQWAWLSLFIWKYQDPELRLLSTGGFTLEEIAADFLFGMLLDCNKPNADRAKGFEYRKILAVELIDSYRPDKHYGFMRAATTKDSARFQDIDDVLTWSETFKHRDALFFATPATTFARRYTAPRPKGLKDRVMTFIPRWGEIKTKLAMFDVMWSILGSNSPIKPIEEEKPKAKPEGNPEGKPKETPKIATVVDMPDPGKTPDPKKVNEDDD